MKKLLTLMSSLTLTALPAAKAAAFPSISTLGLTVKDQTNIAKPMDFEAKVAQAVKLDQSRHGCTWASLPEIYAFADAVVYTKSGSSSFNVFTPDTANSRGCALPQELQSELNSNFAAVSYENQADMGASYSLVSITDVKTLKSGDTKSSYYNIGDRQKAAPPTLLSDMKTGLQLTQAQHGCKEWATRPFIFVFSDAVAYVNSQATDVNVFSIDEVKAKGCNVPNVRLGDRRNILSTTSMDLAAPEMVAEAGLDDVNQKIEAAQESQMMSVSTPNALKDNLKRGFCAGRWTYFDKWTVFDVDYSKFTIEVTDALLTGAFKQSVDRSALRTLRFPVSYSKYFTAGDGAARASAARFAHVTATGVCNHDAGLQTITTKGLDVFKETLPLNSDQLVDSNDRSVRALKEVVTIPGSEVCSNHVQRAGKSVCNRVTVTDTCEVRYYDVVREQVVITKTYTKNIDVKDSKPRTITALRSTVPGITRTQLKDPSNTLLDANDQSTQGEIFNATCNTGDDKPLETMADIQARFNFLEYNIKQVELGATMTPGCETVNSPDCTLTQEPDFVGFVKNFWGLHQEFNDKLTPEQREAIRQRHILFPKYIFPGHEEILVIDVD
jgi:hypothetical protein